MPQNYVEYSKLIALAPEFAELEVPFVDEWIEFTQSLVGLSFWKECAEAAHFLITAHFLELHPSGGLEGEGTGGETGSIVSEGNGPASRAFSAPASASGGGTGGWGRTRYGRMYMDMQTKVKPRASIIAVRSGYNNGMGGLRGSRRGL